MTLNCEQTLNNLPHLVTKATKVTKTGARTAEPVSEETSRRALLMHLRTCPACQREYETLWQTANVLETTAAPIPPPELVGNIQERVRQLHRQQQVAFFASPVAWCLDRLKLDFSARFVNATVLLFFLIASGLVVKLGFFTDSQEPEFGLTAMERSRLQHVRVSSSPWALIKDKETVPSHQQAVIAVQGGDDHFFGTAQRRAKMWRVETANAHEQAAETRTASYSEEVASEKLTVFWNHIKTEL